MELKRIETGMKLTTTSAPVEDVVVLYGDGLIERAEDIRGNVTYTKATTRISAYGVLETTGVLCLHVTDGHVVTDKLIEAWADLVELDEIATVVEQAHRFGVVRLINQRNLTSKD